MNKLAVLCYMVLFRFLKLFSELNKNKLRSNAYITSTVTVVKVSSMFRTV